MCVCTCEGGWGMGAEGSIADPTLFLEGTDSPFGISAPFLISACRRASSRACARFVRLLWAYRAALYASCFALSRASLSAWESFEYRRSSRCRKRAAWWARPAFSSSHWSSSF